jgi:hypothetical protein
MAPRGDMRGFVEQTQSGVTMAGDDVNSAAKALVEFYRAKQSGHKLIHQDRKSVEQFERKELTRKLAETLSQTLNAKL